MKVREDDQHQLRSEGMSVQPRPLLVIGAGIAGVTAALEAAEAGAEVVLVEREPTSAAACSRTTTTSPRCVRPPAAWRSTSGGSSATRGSGCSPARGHRRRAAPTTAGR